MNFFRSRALLFIILLSAALRLTALSNNPISLNWDEVSEGYTAYSLLKTGADEWGVNYPLQFRAFGEWKSPVYIYTLIPFIKIFGLTPLAVRLPAALSGVVVTYLTYLIGKHVYGRRVGLLASLLIAVSPWHLMLSRPGFEASMALALVLAGIWFLISKPFDVKNSYLRILLSSLFFGLAPYTYNSAKIITPLLVIFLTYLLRKTITIRQILLLYLVLFIMAAPMLTGLRNGVTQGRFRQVGVSTDLEQKSIFTNYRNTFPLPQPVNRLLFNKYSFTLVKSFQNWSAYFSPQFLLTEGGNRAQHSIPYRGVLYFTEFALAVIGISQLRKKKDSLAWLPIVLILVGSIPAALTKDPQHVLRSIMSLPGYQLLAAYGLVSLYKNKHKIAALMTKLFATEVVCFLALYFLWYPRAFAEDWQYGYQEAVNYAVENSHKYDKIYFTKWYGEPQLFVAFYSKWDPSDLQAKYAHLIEYEKRGLPWLDQLPEYEVGKYHFGYLDWKGGDAQQNLYIGKADDFWPDTKVLKEIRRPDGTVAFVIVEGP